MYHSVYSTLCACTSLCTVILAHTDIGKYSSMVYYVTVMSMSSEALSCPLCTCASDFPKLLCIACTWYVLGVFVIIYTVSLDLVWYYYIICAV